ncbi:hypothetical protein QF037_000875 [Streptomyces canus]|uniref:hypothetical protein n=1 Tax=Streptomyces canus TaxID=58343 RepID=UPI00278ACC12|nr:hypothetical protein [Streptomyces canus]MDQ0596530.1 hypothetical protein [Streptomyces canus]
MRFRFLATALLTAAAVAACAPGTDSGAQGANEDVSLPGQQWALRDDRVTAGEYRTAITRFLACVEDSGYRTGAPVTSPIDGLSLLYDITPSGDPATYNDRVQRCNLGHLSMIEPTYVEQHRKVMDQPLKRAVGECLEGRGVRVSGTEQNATDFAVTARDEPVVVECVTETRQQLYPDLPDFAVVRI